MVCIGIPVCRPLYKRYLDRWFASGEPRHQEHPLGLFSLRTFGGSTMIRPGAEDKVESKQTSSNRTGNSTLITKEETDIDEEELKLGVNGPFSTTYAVGGARNRHLDDQSDEWPLGNDFRTAVYGESNTEDPEQVIHAVDEYEVIRSRDR